MKKYIIVNSANSAYQAGVMTKNGQNPTTWIIQPRNWHHATKFVTIDAALTAMRNEKIRRYRVFEAGTNLLVAYNGTPVAPYRQLV